MGDTTTSSVTTQCVIRYPDEITPALSPKEFISQCRSEIPAAFTNITYIGPQSPKVNHFLNTLPKSFHALANKVDSDSRICMAPGNIVGPKCIELIYNSNPEIQKLLTREEFQDFVFLIKTQAWAMLDPDWHPKDFNNEINSQNLASALIRYIQNSEGNEKPFAGLSFVADPTKINPQTSTTQTDITALLGRFISENATSAEKEELFRYISKNSWEKKGIDWSKFLLSLIAFIAYGVISSRIEINKQKNLIRSRCGANTSPQIISNIQKAFTAQIRNVWQAVLSPLGPKMSRVTKWLMELATFMGIASLVHSTDFEKQLDEEHPAIHFFVSLGMDLATANLIAKEFARLQPTFQEFLEQNTNLCPPPPVIEPVKEPVTERETEPVKVNPPVVVFDWGTVGLIAVATLITICPFDGPAGDVAAWGAVLTRLGATTAPALVPVMAR